MAFCILTSTFCLSSSAQPFAIDWRTIDGGGGTSSGGQFAVSGAIGQPDAGPAMIGGNYSIQGGFWSAYVAVQTPGAPTLIIKRVGSNVEISWPVEGSFGFVLEETGSLTPTVSWLNATTTPVVVENQYVTTLPVQAGQHFFRLRRPQE